MKIKIPNIQTILPIAMLGCGLLVSEVMANKAEQNQGQKASQTSIVAKNQDSKTSASSKVVEISLDQTKANLYVGETLQLTATIKNGRGNNVVLWLSSDEKIASVDKAGKVTAIAEGTAVITVTVDNIRSASSTITVTKKVVPTTMPSVQPSNTNVNFSPTPTPTLAPTSNLPRANIIESQLFNFINQERIAQGATALSSSSLLYSGASTRLNEEVGVTIDHNRPNGDPFHTIFGEIGYAYSTCGENIVSGYQSRVLTTSDEYAIAELLFNAWKNSPGHYANMINSSFSETGLAVVVYSSNGSTYYYALQLFADD